MAALAGEGARFDLVICDPPAFAPSKQALQQGLRAYERVARLRRPRGAGRRGDPVLLLACRRPGQVPRACLRGLGRAGRDPRLIHTGFAGPDHPQHPALTETGYLKALAFRLMP
jgi:23S rRNA (cytosine1962-C5)-methyltransferase